MDLNFICRVLSHLSVLVLCLLDFAETYLVNWMC
jgi:hypothetical protein